MYFSGRIHEALVSILSISPKNKLTEKTGDLLAMSSAFQVPGKKPKETSAGTASQKTQKTEKLQGQSECLC